MDFDPEAKQWDHAKGEITWDDVMIRWRGRGPANERFVRQLQRGVDQLSRAACP
jgi:ring-1,2-phenylacetyl-CoA epoxidase subunit PaaA